MDRLLNSVSLPFTLCAVEASSGLSQKIASQYLELKGVVGESKLIRWADIRSFALKGSEGATSFIINMKYSPVIDFRSLFLTLKFDELTLEQLLALLIKAKEKYSRLEDF